MILSRLWFAGLLGMTAACAPVQRSQPLRPIQFLLVNDVYRGDTTALGTGGIARIATLKSELEKRGPVLFMLAGDFLSPSLLSKWYGGRQMIEMFNAARLDYATLGNHEFDFDERTLNARIAESRFRWTSANCERANGNAFPQVSRWDTLTVEGVRIGIFGVTLRESYRSYVRCHNPDSSAAVAIARLKAAGAQFIVGLTHQTRSADSALLAREPAIDLILGGHEHDWQEVALPGRKVLKADANGESAQLVSVTRTSAGLSQTSRLIPIDRSIPMEPVTNSIVERWQDSLRTKVGVERVIGTTTIELDNRLDRMRKGETPLGNLITDAFRLGSGADVAIVNTGTVRFDDTIVPGPITDHTIQSMFLFLDNAPIVVFPLTGARLREVVEHGLSRPNSGRFLQVSGLSFTWDAKLPVGSRIVGELSRENGTAIGKADILRVGLTSYPACEAGDGYKVPEAAEACRTLASAPRGPDLVIDHIANRLKGVVREPAGPRMRKQ